MGKGGAVLRIIYLTIVTFFLCFAYQHTKAETTDLQTLIDNAKGDTLILHEGKYLANVTINKPIKIIADGQVYIKPANQNEPIITIQNTKQVSIEGINFETSKNAILIKDAQTISLSNLSIQNVDSGIEMYRVKDIKIRNNSVIGNDNHYANKGNGIAIFYSENISIEENNINKVQDGIYIEEVRDITVRNNRVENSRYGTHFMYSENAMAEENIYQKNVTGLMVMMTQNVQLLKNEVAYQEGFNGTGITLYEVNDAKVAENNVDGNRIAITIQKTSKVQISSNKFQMNQTAVESIKSDNSNIATENLFVGNLVNVRTDAIGMKLEKNYYDDYSGIDLDDDGIGDESYIALQSFGQWMVRKPVYQYYVEAPSVVLLNAIDKVTNKSEQRLLVDKIPKTDFHINNEKEFSINYWQLIIGLLLLFGCAIVLKRSVLK